MRHCGITLFKAKPTDTARTKRNQFFDFFKPGFWDTSGLMMELIREADRFERNGNTYQIYVFGDGYNIEVVPLENGKKMDIKPGHTNTEVSGDSKLLGHGNIVESLVQEMREKIEAFISPPDDLK